MQKRINPQLMLWIVLLKCRFFLQVGELLCSCSVPVESAPIPKMGFRSKCAWPDHAQGSSDMAELQDWNLSSHVWPFGPDQKDLLSKLVWIRVQLSFPGTLSQGLLKDQSVQSILQTPWILATLVVFHKKPIQSGCEIHPSQLACKVTCTCKYLSNN